jgi:hypothetical protein
MKFYIDNKIVIIISLTLLSSCLCNYCSYETCRRCCQVTPSGCINAIDFNIRVQFIKKRGDTFQIILFAEIVSVMTLNSAVVGEQIIIAG